MSGPWKPDRVSTSPRNFINESIIHKISDYIIYYSLLGLERYFQTLRVLNNKFSQLLNFENYFQVKIIWLPSMNTLRSRAPQDLYTGYASYCS